MSRSPEVARCRDQNPPRTLRKHFVERHFDEAAAIVRPPSEPRLKVDDQRQLVRVSPIRQKRTPSKMSASSNDTSSAVALAMHSVDSGAMPT